MIREAEKVKKIEQELVFRVHYHLWRAQIIIHIYLITLASEESARPIVNGVFFIQVITSAVFTPSVKPLINNKHAPNCHIHPHSKNEDFHADIAAKLFADQKACHHQGTYCTNIH